ncbi:hypothetical protein GCM10019059_11000 [Camelimonas fluminis]|nr:hypothetical protein GCM10019059_11000 [Camelimonas fluminis]
MQAPALAAIADAPELRESERQDLPSPQVKRWQPDMWWDRVRARFRVKPVAAKRWCICIGVRGSPSVPALPYR